MSLLYINTFAKNSYEKQGFSSIVMVSNKLPYTGKPMTEILSLLQNIRPHLAAILNMASQTIESPHLQAKNGNILIFWVQNSCFLRDIVQLVPHIENCCTFGENDFTPDESCALWDAGDKRTDKHARVVALDRERRKLSNHTAFLQQ